jgi:hypothetical protein
MEQKKRDIRPLKQGEFRQNKDGTRSTEISKTVTHPNINNGAPTNIPSLYVVNGKVTEFPDDDEAVKAAQDTGLQFPSFPDIPSAVKDAQTRSNEGGVAAGKIGEVIKE